jgi:hypothetical protein
VSFWKALKLLLTLHCEESTQLLSAGLERDLSAVERWAVRLHAVVCKQCRRFRRQLRFLQRAGRQWGERPVDSTLPADVRAKILRRLGEP